MNSQGRSSHASSQASLNDQSLPLSYPYDIWPDTKTLPDCSQLNLQLPPLSPYNQDNSRLYSAPSYHRIESNLGDIDQLNRINPEQIRNVGIDELTRPLNEQPYQVGLQRIPTGARWQDQGHYQLSRSLPEPMNNNHIDELFSNTGSELLASGVGSYYQGNQNSAFAIPRAKTVINSSSQKDSVIGGRQLQRTVSTNTSSQRSRGPGSTGTARRRSMGPPPPCSACGKVLKNQSDVTKHAKSHTKPYKCSIPECPKHMDGFSTPNDRDRHERSKHRKVTNDEKDRGYVCSACTTQQPSKPEKWWPRLDNFKSHIEKKHPEHDVGDVITLSLRDRRPDDDTLSIAPSNGFSISHADNDLRYQNDYMSMQSQSNILKLSQQGEISPWDTHTSIETHDLAGIGQAQAADDVLFDRKHHTFSHGCHETDEPAVLLRSGVPQPVTLIIKDDEDERMEHNEDDEMKLEDSSSSPTSIPKNESLKENRFFYSSNIYKSEECNKMASKKRLLEDENQLRCTHKRCHSTFKRECDRRKHEQRHIRPYGCTWPKCYERHGSKSDWIRHERKVHMLADRWLCMHTIDDGKQCRTCFWKEDELRKHILANHKTSHHDLEELVSQNHIDSMFLGRQGQVRFWCGFCCAVIENHAHAQGKDSFTARCDHIGAHIDSRGGRHIKDWVCVEFMMRKEELMKVLKLTGKHPDPHGYDKDLPAPVEDDEWKKAVFDVDVNYSAMHAASFSRMKDVSFKVEPT